MVSLALPCGGIEYVVLDADLRVDLDVRFEIPGLSSAETFSKHFLLMVLR